MSGDPRAVGNVEINNTCANKQQCSSTSRRFKARKYANRQGFQDRRKNKSVDETAISANTFAFGFSSSDSSAQKRNFSISSESNASFTELQACNNIQSESTPWLDGCSVWTDQQLKSAMEEQLANQATDEEARCVKMILESNDESLWCALTTTYCDVGVLWAALGGNSSMLLYLLQQGADSRAADAEGRTAMHYAACSSANFTTGLECIALLAQYGADVNVWDKGGQATPLICAAATGRLPIVDILLRSGADVNAGLADPRRPDSATALLWAVRARSLHCANRLIEAGAAVNSPQAYSEAPVHVASAQGDVECLSLLLQHQADVRVLLGRERMSAVHLAAEEGNANCLRLLLNARADCNFVNARGQTPLHLATMASSVESVALLLEAGARLDICDNEQKSPLHYAVVKSSRSTDIVRMLISGGADTNARDQCGYTPLHLAAINENSKVAAIMVQSGSDLSAKTKGGETALAFLVRRTPDVLTSIPRRFDSAVTVADHDPLDPDCELQLDFCFLIPCNDQQRVGESGILMTLIQADQRHVLQHAIVRAFLHMKWFKIRSLFICSLLFHAAFVLALTTNILSIYVSGAHSTWGSRCKYNDSSTAEAQPSSDVWPKELAAGVMYLALIFGALSAIKEIFQMFQSPMEYARNPENCFQIVLIAGVVLINLPANEWGQVESDWQQHVAAIIIVVAWTELMMHVGRFPVFGLYVQMFTTVAANIAKFLTAYLSLIIGFSLGLAVLYPDTPALAKLPFSLLTTFVMMTGELDYKDYFYVEALSCNDADNPDKPKYHVTTHLVFLAFLLFIVVVLMNLLVGLAVSDIQGLRKCAGLDRLIRIARLIARMESIVFSPWLNQLPCSIYSPTRQWLQRKILIVPPHCRRIYSLRPNDPRDDRFPPDIKEGILQIVLANKTVKRNHYDMHRRTSAGLANGSLINGDVLDGMVNEVNNAVQQISKMSSCVEEHLSQLENQNTLIRNKLDKLLELLDHSVCSRPSMPKTLTHR